MNRGYQCEGCLKFSAHEPWPCPTCKTEVCDSCFIKYAHCKPCSISYPGLVLLANADKEGWDFCA